MCERSFKLHCLLRQKAFEGKVCGYGHSYHPKKSSGAPLLILHKGKEQSILEGNPLIFNCSINGFFKGSISETGNFTKSFLYVTV
jgi:hypothetical protein